MSDPVSPGRLGIVPRLRLVSTIIVVLLLVETGIGGLLLVGLKARQEETTGHHIPMLAMSSELQADLAGIHLLVDGLHRAVVDDELGTLENGADVLFDRMGATLGRMRAVAVDGRTLRSLSASLVEARRDFRDTTRVARRVVAGRRAHDADAVMLGRLRERFRLLVEPTHTDVTHALRGALEAARPRSGAAEESWRGELDRLLLVQGSLKAITHGVDFVVDVTTALTRPGEASGDASGEADRVRFELRSLPTVLMRLGSGEPRATIATMIAELRAIVLGDGGTLDRDERLRLDGRAMIDADASLKATFDTMSTLVERIVVELESLAASTATELERATDLTLLVLIVTVVLVLALVLVTGYVVLERQISRRIGVLAAEVLRIASGDDGEPVAIGGEDEIGQIARSLKVFRENARELRRSNEELGKFAYAAAHDMRSPLRAIESLATWTLEDAGDGLSEDCRDNLQTLLARAQRLSTLQTDLLDYARVGEADSSFADVDIRTMIEEIRSLIDPGERFEIVVLGTDRAMRTHLVPLRQVLMNLFGNAMKHHDGSDGVIVVTIGERSSRLRLEVRDDGPGIEPRFHDKVFGLFTTLQSKDVVEGSGLGLSMVRKIVERYDGRVTIASDPERGRGTTFRFDLPLQDDIAADDVRKAA